MGAGRPCWRSARRTIRTEQREAHRFTGALLDSLRVRVVVQVRLGEARAGGVDLDPSRPQARSHGERHSVESRLGRRVDGAEDRAPGEGRVGVPRQRASATENTKETVIQDLGALCVFVVKPFASNATSSNLCRRIERRQCSSSHGAKTGLAKTS